MKHINKFPDFTQAERDELRLKIVHGVIESHTAAQEADRIHFLNATREGKDWVSYPCWLSASKWSDGKGFRKFKFKTHALYIHRASYEVFTGPIPEGLLLDHLCRVRGCCNPVHLEPVPAKVNIERGGNQNHLLRNGAPPPVTAKEVNPRFFDVPAFGEVAAEHWRRQRDGSDYPRLWHDAGGNPPPTPPDGFRWEISRGFVGQECIYVLNPIRETPLRDQTDVPLRSELPALSDPAFQLPPFKFTPLPEGMTEIEYIARSPSDVLKDLKFIEVPLSPMCDEEVLRRCGTTPGVFTPVDPHEDPFYLKMPLPRAESWVRRKWLQFKTWLNGEAAA